MCVCVYLYICMYIYIPLTSQDGLQSKDAYISYTCDRSWYSQELDGLNPDWFSLSKLFSWRISNDEFKMRLSSILPKIGTSETGL